ncbi:MAG TPA: class I SAM-dependent methyltransferase [Candidatus Bathyarchaeia archaeon]|nr:class I SAM-dependent methyltransferase [Candidatus Bathyarchaeia archaeon]
MKYLPPEGSLILDIGIDPAIFSEKIIQLNRKITIGDISEEQLQITREKFTNSKLASQVEEFSLLDSFCELTQFEDETFDMAISLFGTLSYTCELKYKMFTELVRVVKKGAPIIITVKNKLNYLRQLVLNEQVEKLQEPNKSGILDFITTNIKQFDEYPEEPLYFAFNSNELMEMITSNSCEILELSAINLLSPFPNNTLNKLIENEETWQTYIDIEKKIATNRFLLDSGDEILAIARKSII